MQTWALLENAEPEARKGRTTKNTPGEHFKRLKRNLMNLKRSMQLCDPADIGASHRCAACRKFLAAGPAPRREGPRGPMIRDRCSVEACRNTCLAHRRVPG